MTCTGFAGVGCDSLGRAAATPKAEESFLEGSPTGTSIALQEKELGKKHETALFLSQKHLQDTAAVVASIIQGFAVKTPLKAHGLPVTNLSRGAEGGQGEM